MEAEGFIAAVACYFFLGWGVLVALDGRRNCGRRIFGGGWGSDPASFRPTRDYWPSDPEGAVGAATWASLGFSLFFLKKFGLSLVGHAQCTSLLSLFPFFGRLIFGSD